MISSFKLVLLRVIMNNIFVKIKKQNGVTSIMITLIVIAGMLFVALTVNDIVQNGLRMSRAHLDSAKAYFAAESGTERILWKIRKTGPPAFNPTNATPLWTDDNCISLSSGLDECDTACNTSNAVEIGEITQVLVNGSKYMINYKWDGDATDPAIFTTTGVYNDITKRVVQVGYKF